MKALKTQQVLLVTSIIALVDLACRRFVGFDGNICVAGKKALGVVDADTEAGNAAPANVTGIMLVESGGAFAVGAEVESDATGRAVVKASGTSNGFALDESTAAGEIVRIARGI